MSVKWKDFPSGVKTDSSARITKLDKLWEILVIVIVSKVPWVILTFWLLKYIKVSQNYFVAVCSKVYLRYTVPDWAAFAENTSV